MGKSFLLARSNLRASKGQAASIAMLILLAALMLNLWLMLSWDYKQNFARNHDRLNAEHVTLVAGSGRTDNDTPGNGLANDDLTDNSLANDGLAGNSLANDSLAQIREFLTQTLENDPRTAEFSLDPALYTDGSFPYNGGEINLELVILEKQAAVSRPVGKIEILEDSQTQSGVYLPILYQSDEVAVGKTLEISVGGKQISYPVCGFFNSMMAGSHNCAITELVLTQDLYQELEKTGYAPQSMLCCVRLKDRAESESYEAMLREAMASMYPTVRTKSNSYALVTQSRYIAQMICSGVLSAMAFFILLIALVVITSNIANYIQEHMKSLGALKAIGYTGGQLICSLLLQFLGISLIAATVGAGVSYVLFPILNAMMVSQTGIPYAIHFLPLPFLSTLVILCGAVAFTVWLSSRRIKKIEPILALRSGVRTHNFKRNHVPLEKAGTPLSLTLALKITLSGWKQNVTICITMLVLSLILVFSGMMLENVIADMTPFLNLMVGEMADSSINVNAATEGDFLQELDADPRVEKMYPYHSVDVQHADGSLLMATICDDFSMLNNQSIVFEGRFPKFDNEIAIAAKYAGEKGLHVGDEITMSESGKEVAYIISGFTQLSNNLGKDCLLTRSGYGRLSELQTVSYYLNLADGTDIEAFHADVKAQFGREINATIDIAAMVDVMASVYVSLITAIVAALLVLSAIVIAFVLYLLVRTMLGNRNRDYGILKAVGFTTGQLILQTALSFMPTVIFSTIVGVALCSLIINPLLALFLGGIGIVKCTFAVPIGFITVAGAGLILFAFITICLLSFKIKKITPLALLTGE